MPTATTGGSSAGSGRRCAAGERWTATVELEPDDQVHGLGERAAPLNLRPGTYGLWNTEQSGSYGPEADPLYITIPVHLVVGPGRPTSGFWENTHQGTVTVGDTLTRHLRGRRAAHLRLPRAARPGARAVPHADRALGAAAEVGPRLPPVPLGLQDRGRHPGGPGRVPGTRPAGVGHPLRHRLHGPVPGLHGERGGLPGPGRPDRRHSRPTASRAVTIIDPGVAKADDFPLYVEGRDAGPLPEAARRQGGQRRRVAGAGRLPGLLATRRSGSGGPTQYPTLLDQGVAGIWHDMCEPAVFAAGVDAVAAAGHPPRPRGPGRRPRRGSQPLRPGHGPGRPRRDAAPSRPAAVAADPLGLGRHPALRVDLDRRRRHVVDDAAPDARARRSTSRCRACRTPGPTSAASRATRPPSSTSAGSRCRRGCRSSGPTRSSRMPSREPWKAAGPHLDAVREAMAWRYRLIPYLYTQAWAHSQTDSPRRRRPGRGLIPAGVVVRGDGEDPICRGWLE